jgi:uncharacterized protein YndB with AHSA1/START domain
MTTKAAERTSLQITRFINASPARVYKAWTDPAELQRWFGPENVRTIDIAAEVRVGGKYCWNLVKQDGEEMSCRGEYRELVPERKVVFTWKWDDDEAWENHNSVVTVEFLARDDGTEVKLTHEQLPSEESRDRHNEGWNSVLDRLEKFFSK